MGNAFYAEVKLTEYGIEKEKGERRKERVIKTKDILQQAQLTITIQK